MLTQSLLGTLHEAGALVSVEDSTLYVEPRSVLTDELRAEIRARKPDLLKYLRWRDEPSGEAQRLTDGSTWLQEYLPVIEFVLRGLVPMDTPLAMKQPAWLRDGAGSTWIRQTVPRIVALERDSRGVGLTPADRKKLLIAFKIFDILERLTLEVFDD